MIKKIGKTLSLATATLLIISSVPVYAQENTDSDYITNANANEIYDVKLDFDEGTSYVYEDYDEYTYHNSSEEYISEYEVNEYVLNELLLMQQLLDEINDVEWTGSGEHTVELTDDYGNLLSVTVKIEKIPSPAEARRWTIENWTSITHVFSPGNWSYTVAFHGPRVGSVEMTSSFTLHRNAHTGLLNFGGNHSARISRLLAPVNFRTTHADTFSIAFGVMSIEFLGFFNHINIFNNRDIRNYQLRKQALHFGTRDEIVFVSDLMFWQ